MSLSKFTTCAIETPAASNVDASVIVVFIANLIASARRQYLFEWISPRASYAFGSVAILAATVSHWMFWKNASMYLAAAAPKSIW